MESGMEMPGGMLDKREDLEDQIGALHDTITRTEGHLVHARDAGADAEAMKTHQTVLDGYTAKLRELEAQLAALGTE